MSIQTIEKYQSDIAFDLDQTIEQSCIESKIQQVTADSYTEELIGSKIPGIDALQDGTYTVELDKTTSDMLLTINNMETQLENVLNINTSLEKEVVISKELLTQLKDEKAQLQANIEQLKSQLPSKREMQIQLDHVEGEKDQALKMNRDLKLSNEQMKTEVQKLNDMVKTLKDERTDARMEIDYLEVQLKSHQTKNQKYENKINAMRGEKIALTEKLKSVQEELKQAYSDQFKAFQNAKQSQKKR